MYASLPDLPWYGNTFAVNCGVVGGSTRTLMALLQHVVALYADRDFATECGEAWDWPCDMALFGVALMTGYRTLHEDSAVVPPVQMYRFDSGLPFTSHFGMYDPGIAQYVIHK